jgi:uncharacterized membrane protein
MTPPAEAFAALSPAIQVHLVAALAALALGPVALLARKGSPAHRGAGLAWVALMALAALSSLFIRDFGLPNVAGYTPIHLLTVATAAGLVAGLWALARRRIRAHRRAMWSTYVGGCLVAGAFALLPERVLGRWLWAQVLGAA